MSEREDEIVSRKTANTGIKVLCSLQLHSRAAFMFDLCHDAAGVEGLRLLLHTVLGEKVCVEKLRLG